MKKSSLSLLSVFLLLGTVSNAQVKHEIGVSTGVVSTQDAVDVLVDLAYIGFANIWDSNLDPEIDYTVKPVYTLSYSVIPSERWHFTFDASFHSLERRAMWTNANTNETFTAYVNSHSLSTSVAARFNYTTGDWVQLYSSIGLGVTFHRLDFSVYESNNVDAGSVNFDPYPNFHLNLFGIRVGKEFGGHIEFGAGYRGIVNVGLDYRL